jgi:hypothetical protein
MNLYTAVDTVPHSRYQPALFNIGTKYIQKVIKYAMSKFDIGTMGGNEMMYTIYAIVREAIEKA